MFVYIQSLNQPTWSSKEDVNLAPVAQPEVSSLTLNERIPGSKLSFFESVKGFRARATCLSNHGSWVLDTSPRFLPFPPRNDRTFTQCDVQHVKKNRGLAGNAANMHVALGGSAEKWNVRGSLKYTWRANAVCGPWIPFDREDFCRLMERLDGNMLIVGDSLTGLFEYSMLHHMYMGVKSGQGRPVKGTPAECKEWMKQDDFPGDMHLCESFAYCGDIMQGGRRFTSITIRNDHLMLNEKASRDGLNYYVPWIDVVGKWNIKVLVMNRGAHYEEDEKYLLGLWQTLHRLRELYPDLLVIFRNTAAGHYNCTEYNAPLDKPQESSLLPYNWDKFSQQNGMAKEIVEAIGGVYMDVEKMTGLRPDGHFGWLTGKYDCLHYCLPGPVDVWVQLLYNLMK